MRRRLETPEAIRSAHAAAGAQIYRDTIDLVKDLTKNPVVELVIGIVLIERLQRAGILSDFLGSTMELGIGGIITAQQLAPLMPAIAGAGKDLMGALGPFLTTGAAALALPGPP